MVLNQPPVNWGPWSLQMVRGTPKTVSQCRIIVTAALLASHPLLRDGMAAM